MISKQIKQPVHLSSSKGRLGRNIKLTSYKVSCQTVFCSGFCEAAFGDVWTKEINFFVASSTLGMCRTPVLETANKFYLRMTSWRVLMQATARS